jgi:transcriptional regulator with XRE-family HTH domain
MLKLSIERQKHGLSQTKLAIRADMNPCNLNQIELGRLPIVWPAWRKKLSEALGVPETELFDRGGHPLEEVPADGDKTA